MNNIFPNPRPAPLRGWRALPLLALLACAWLLPGRAQAANTCEIVSSSPIAFGTVDGSGGTTSSTVQFRCRNDGPSAVRNFRVCLYANTPWYSGNVDPREIIKWFPFGVLNYRLYSDPSLTQLIGSPSSGHPPYSTGLTTSSSGGWTSGSMIIHGRVEPGQTPPAGNYSSSIDLVLRAVTTTSGSPLPAPAQCANPTSTDSDSINVTATFANTCYISSATDMNFGAVANLASPLNQTSTIDLRCPTNTDYQVGLNYGNHSTVVPNRRMLGPGGNYLDYQLYQDSNRSQVWGNTTADDVEGDGNGGIQTLTVYGQVPAAQWIGAAGAYSDTITITLTY